MRLILSFLMIKKLSLKWSNISPVFLWVNALLGIISQEQLVALDQDGDGILSYAEAQRRYRIIIIEG